MWHNDLIDAQMYAMIGLQGCATTRDSALSRQGIDEKTGVINVYELLPQQGDSLMVVNCGSHFEIRYHHWQTPPLALTDEDIEDLRQGRIVWN